MKKIIIIIFSLFLLTSCASHQEINDLGIVSALGIEKNNNEYIVSAQLVNTKKISENPNSASNVITFIEKGDTIFETLRKITTKSSRKLYFAHMKLIIIDDSILNENPLDIVDFLARDSESMLNFIVLASVEDKPSDILETLTPFEEIPAEYILKSVKESERSFGNTFLLTFDEYINDLVSQEKNLSFTKIKLTKESKIKNNLDSLKTSTSNYIELGNILVFNENKKLTELSFNESNSFNIMSNNTINGIITLPCDNNKFYTLEIMNSKSSWDFKEKDKIFTFNTNITISVSNYSCKDDLIKSQTIEKIKNQTKEYLENNNNQVLKLSQKYNNDFLGIGGFIKSKNKNYFDFKKDNWNKNGLNKLKLVSKVNVNYEKRGNLLNVIKEKGD